MRTGSFIVYQHDMESYLTTLSVPLRASDNLQPIIPLTKRVFWAKCTVVIYYKLAGEELNWAEKLKYIQALRDSPYVIFAKPIMDGIFFLHGGCVNVQSIVVSRFLN